MSTLQELLLSAGLATPVSVDQIVARRVVVARHAGLIEYLREVGLCGPGTPVLPHVHNPDVIEGKLVIGVLPNWIASRALAIVEVPLVGLTPADRAAGDLPVERVRELAGAPTVYTVRCVGEVR